MLNKRWQTRREKGKLPRKRDDVPVLIPTTHNVQDTQKQSMQDTEAQAKKLQADNDEKLELANQAVQDAEKKAEDRTRM